MRLLRLTTNQNLNIHFYYYYIYLQPKGRPTFNILTESITIHEKGSFTTMVHRSGDGLQSLRVTRNRENMYSIQRQETICTTIRTIVTMIFKSKIVLYEVEVVHKIYQFVEFAELIDF